MAKFFQFLWDHKQSLFFLLLLLFSLVALSLSGKQRFHLARRINRAVITPFQMVVSQADYFLHLKRDNEELRKNNFILALELFRLEEAKKQNLRLERLLDFARKAPVYFIACRVISGGLGEHPEVFIIDKGSLHGLRPNLPVLVPEGLVGKTIETDPGRAVVQLYKHQDFRVSAKSYKNDERGIAGSGPGGAFYLYNITLRTQLEMGDLIISSGMGGIFPRGIPIGRVAEIEKEEEMGIKLRAKLVPAVDLDKVSEVFVLADSAFVAPAAGELYETTDTLLNMWNEP